MRHEVFDESAEEGEKIGFDKQERRSPASVIDLSEEPPDERRHPAEISEKSTTRDSKENGTDAGHECGDAASGTRHLDELDEDELLLQLEKTEAEEELQRTTLKKIELKQKLAFVRKRRADR